jgi:uncharacterized membrane protein
MLLRCAFRRETAIPLIALMFGTGVSCVLVFARIAAAHQVIYAFLLWNLFLAWIPLIVSLVVYDLYRAGQTRSWRFGCLAALWLLFYPNAPYILTDIIHLTERFEKVFWIDLSLVLSCGFTGLVLGFVSLYLTHSMVAEAFSPKLGWAFTAAVSCVSGFGIYLGRFLRFNSWDVVLNPIDFYHGLTAGLSLLTPWRPPHAPLVFAVLFSLFLFVSYVMLYSLTRLHLVQSAAPVRAFTPARTRSLPEPVSSPGAYSETTVGR